MMILWKEKLAFIAVPKTGTTAIEAALLPHSSIAFQRPPHIKHMTLRRFNRFIRPYLSQTGRDDIETIALMREPLDWLGSWYRYRQRRKISGTSKSTEHLSFAEFIEAYLAEGKRPDFAEIGSQARQLSSRPGQIGVDHLFRYDQINRATSFLAARLNMKITLEQNNTSKKMHLELAPRLEAKLREKYAFDFETYAAIT